MEKKTFERLWKIHGSFYDFHSFQDSHPGGATLLMLGRGRDSTELWESVHQFAANPEVFRPLFDKYKVDVKQTETLDEASEFDWSPEKAVFSFELRRKAREYFQSTGKGRKADSFFAAFFSVYTIIMITCIGYMLTHRSFLITTVSAIMISLYGFAIMHTGSHFGLSSSPFINWFSFSSFCNLLGWFHHLWLQHHVWGHHSYTGILNKDPDVSNIPKKFCRKHRNLMYYPQYESNLKTELFLLWIFPSQFVGQGVQYFCTLWRGKVFGMDVVQRLTMLDVLTTGIEFSIFIFCFLVLPILSTGPGHIRYVIWCYFIMGIMYWACVVPNHEVVELATVTTNLTRDWSIEQIRHSSNFKLPYWMSFLIGGMNYQIEHHLFPTVHPRHYPALSEIVQEMCKVHGIPYICHDSWLSAIDSHFQFMKYFANPNN